MQPTRPVACKFEIVYSGFRLAARSGRVPGAQLIRKSVRLHMTQIESEGEWLAALTEKSKLVFLASLSHNLTVAGRNSYEPQTEALEKPEQLRRVNEIQHRISACMCELLTNQSNISFQKSISNWVLEQLDTEFRDLMEWAWRTSKERIPNDA